jgi:hypothetical protein
MEKPSKHFAVLVVVAFINTGNSSRLFTNYFARQRDYFTLEIVRAFRLFSETELTATLAPVSRLSAIVGESADYRGFAHCAQPPLALIRPPSPA